jgi:hypothetical protein
MVLVHVNYHELQLDEQYQHHNSNLNVKRHLPRKDLIDKYQKSKSPLFITFIGIPVTVVNAKLCCFNNICNILVNNICPA